MSICLSLRRFLPYEKAMLSHDTLCDVIAAIDPAQFKACFLAWMADLRDDTPEVIAIDGKTLRRSHARGKGRLALHTVSAWATRQRLVLGQEAVAEKANEIVAIPLLLRRLELTGALVTIDAMGIQKEIAQTILNGGADYVLSLKENWPATDVQVQQAFADPSTGLTIQRSETVDADHGRIETWRHAVCHDVSWMVCDRRYPGAFAFPGLAAIGMIERETERGGQTQIERHYYLCSIRLDAETLGRVVRGIGASKTTSTGPSTWCSATIWRACVQTMARLTWPSSGTPL